MAAYCPKRGDVVWISFNPQAGHEQAGHRPALVLSPEPYNRKVGLVLLCPITNQVKGYPFEVSVPDGLKASGVVLSDQVKSYGLGGPRGLVPLFTPGDNRAPSAEQARHIVGCVKR